MRNKRSLGEKEKAIAQMKKLILSNNLYTEYSAINYEKGYAESDPMYSEDVYSNYYVQQMEKNVKKEQFYL